MADDLMDFTDAENKENSSVSDRDENDLPVAPGLVQSPVIVNSILKQSNKDNLIQLYTPVQKPEKGRLKVHFGHDSILQTPNVKQVKKIVGDALPIKEDLENTSKEDTERKQTSTSDTSTADTDRDTLDSTKKEVVNTDSEEVAKEVFSHVIEQLPIKDDKETPCSADSGLEECAMEVSICEPTPTETLAGADDYDFDDILLKSEMLLKSLRGESYTTDFSSAESESGQTTSDASDKTADVGVENDSQTTKVAADSDTLQCQKTGGQGISVNDASEASSNEVNQLKFNDNAETEEKKDNEEKAEAINEIRKESEMPSSARDEVPMDTEEAMDVDYEEEDDEIVFNFGGNKNVAESKGAAEEKSSDHTEETNDVCEATDKNANENVDKDNKIEDNRKNEKPDVDKTDGENTEKTASKDSCVKDEVKESVKEINNVDNEGNIAKKCEIEPEKTVADEETTNIQTPLDIEQTKQDVKIRQEVKIKGDDSSDEEFMSADEDVEVEVKTPVKSSKPETQNQQNVEVKPEEESPERIPPKVGYNLNFDDLNGVDPFSSKKSLMNSPDVGRETTVEKKCVKETDGPIEKSDSKIDAKKMECSQSASPVKSSPLKVPHSPNAILVDILCQQKTAGDIFEEKPDCLLTDDSKQATDTEILPKNADKVDSGLEQGMNKEIDFENVDPFKPKKQIVNSPDKAIINKITEMKVENPLQASNQVMNTPDKVDNDVNDIKCVTNESENSDEKQSVNKQNPEQLESEEHPATPHKEIIENKQSPAVSPAIPVAKGAYNLDALDFDDIDPFKPSMQMANSPSGNAGLKKPAEIDPFKPKKQIMNSPAINKKQDETRPSEADALKPNAQILNSPDFKTGVLDNADSSKMDTATVDNIPMKETKKMDKGKNKTDSQVANSPQKEEPKIEVETDPFKSNSKIQNSPAKAKTQDASSNFNIDILDCADPFKPRNQMQNSPANKRDEKNLDQKNLDNVEVIPELSNSSAKEDTKINTEILDIKMNDDPFETKSQIQKSPVLKGGVNKVVKVNTEATDIVAGDSIKSETVDSLSIGDPFKSKEKLPVSPLVKSESAIDPFADLNPFQTKTKVANSPEKSETRNLVQDTNAKSDIDPFKTSNKTCSSPALTSIKEEQFVTKSRGANTPTKEGDPFSEMFESQSAPTFEPTRQEAGIGDIFEVQGVTRRGEARSEAAQFEDIDESQFVSASQVFNDPAAWEMLEKLGGGTSDSGESALSRMSLYVKFDPLVDEAPINPRRISIRVSQLEKVKEYGLDETLLLLGTPPKKRSQSMNRITPSGQKPTGSTNSEHVVKKVEPVGTTPGTAVDLILDYSPGDKKQMEKTVSEEAPVMKLLYEEDSSAESENIFQELKYTETDFKKFQRDNKLLMQGILINKDQELCKEREKWEKEKAELIKKCHDLKFDRTKLEKAFMELEQTAYELLSLKDAAEKKVEKLETEKAQALEDIQAVETAFSDLHRRYEKAKTIVNSMKKNEETLIKTTENALEKLKKSDEKLQTLEKLSEEKLAASKAEIEKLVQQQDSVQSKCEAQVKILTIKIGNLETAIQRKTEENKELTEICDNLLSKVDK